MGVVSVSYLFMCRYCSNNLCYGGYVTNSTKTTVTCRSGGSFIVNISVLIIALLPKIVFELALLLLHQFIVQA